jgi:hypothetical protein
VSLAEVVGNVVLFVAGFVTGVLALAAYAECI